MRHMRVTEDIINSVEQRALDVMRRHCIPIPGASVLLCVSGGPDSMALLGLFSAWQQIATHRVAVLSVDHMLRSESAEEVAMVERITRAKGWEFFAMREDVATEAAMQGVSVETYGRELRRALAEELCQRGHYQYILTGHHQDDQVETMLAHLVRGTGAEGLKGMAYQEGRYVRPFLDCRKADLVAYCEAVGLPYVQDASNEELVYQRNKIRHTVVPTMEALNPRLGMACQRLADIMTTEDAFLQECTEGLYRQALVDIDTEGLVFDKKVVQEAHLALRQRFWRRVASHFAPYGVTPSWQHVQAMDRLLFGEGNKQFSLKWMKICVQYDKIYCAWSCASVATSDETTRVCTYEPRWSAGHSFRKNTMPGTFLVPQRCADTGLEVRPRRSGDRIVLIDATRQAWGHKPLKKYMSEQRIPPSERDTRLWLVSGNEVLCEARPNQDFTLYDPKADSYVLGYFEEERK